MIAANKVVSLNYRLKENNAEGKLIEETYGANPLVFIYGIGAMIPKFEEELAGKKQGDAFAFGIAAADAYGDIDENMKVNVPLDIFKQDGKIEEGLLTIGNVLPMQDNQGNRMDGKVVSVGENDVKMDFNHPLAGVNLYFEGDIVEVRDATPEELEHGHVHGPGGHHH